MKKRTKKQKRLIRRRVFYALCIAGAVLLTASVIKKKDNGPDPVKEPEPPCLNEIITNEMSDIQELHGLDKKIKSYLTRWEIHGASLAIVRNDSLVYAKGYGWADKEEGIEMEPGHIMRMASVSKLITAIGIMVLQEQGKLDIKDSVFGPEGVLNDEFFLELTEHDPNYRKVTIENVMRHQGGFYRDPVFSNIDVRNQMGLDHPPTKEDYFTLVLGRRLNHMPGTYNKYSNFGYILLSEIIEKVSEMPYEDFIKEHVLKPAGCYDMHIAGNYYEDKRENEVRYYTHEGDGKYMEEYNSSGRMVERCYGGNNITLLSGAGAWCGSPIEMARLVASIDGRPEVKDILTEESIGLMTEYFDENTYSLGWNDTHPEKGWSRTGTLAGTSALVKLFPDGECWIMITNTSTYRGPRFTRYTDDLFKQCRSLYSDKLPKRNLFE